MGSLQDQLLKAGLATPEQLRKARAEQRREQRREPRGGRGEAQEGLRTPGTRPAVRGRPGRPDRPDRPPAASPPASDRESGPPRDEDARRAGRPGRGGEGRRRRGPARPDRGKPERQGARRRPADGSPPAPDASVQALNLRIRGLLDRYALNDRNAEVAFHFVRGGTVRRVYVTDGQRRKLAGGELAVVGFRRRHHLVPAAVAEEILALRPIIFVHRAAAVGGEDEAPPPGVSPDAEDDPYRDHPVPDDLRW